MVLRKGVSLAEGVVMLSREEYPSLVGHDEHRPTRTRERERWVTKAVSRRPARARIKHHAELDFVKEQRRRRGRASGDSRYGPKLPGLDASVSSQEEDADHGGKARTATRNEPMKVRTTTAEADAADAQSCL